MVEATWGGGALLRGYLARPATGRPRAAVVVCPDHEGATEFFKGVARAGAKAGHAALLMDPLGREGGTEAVPENERAAVLAAPGAAGQRVMDLRSAAAFLLEQADLPPERLGIIGFGVGGVDAWEAARLPLEPLFRAAVLLSAPPHLLTGTPPGAAVLVHYGQLDRRAASDLPALERRLREARLDHSVRVHPGAGRAFWHEQAAVEPAWRETLDWLAAHLVRPFARRPPTRSRAATKLN